MRLSAEKAREILIGMEPDVFAGDSVDLPLIKKLRQKYGKELVGMLNSTKKTEKAVVNLVTMKREVISGGKPMNLGDTANFVVAICELEMLAGDISGVLDVTCPECGHKLSRKTAYYAGATVSYTCVNAMCEKTAKAIPTPVVLRYKALDYCTCYSYEERQQIKNSMNKLPGLKPNGTLYEDMGVE